MRVLATLHLADLFREPRMRLATRNDWRKVPRMLAGEWPRKVPPSVVAKSPADIWKWFEEALDGDTYVAVDTEYVPETRWLWLWGVASPVVKRTLQVKRDLVDGKTWHAAGEAMREMALTFPAVVYQNAAADLPVLEQAWGAGHAAHRRVDDSCLLHACLWSELPHDLEFLASLYSQYPKLKHLADTDPLAYHQGDLLATLDVWAALVEEAKADPAAWRIYEEQSLALLPILLRTEAHGIRVNASRVKTALDETTVARERAATLAQAYAGWPLNVGSDDQLKVALYGEEAMRVHKHKDTRKPTINADAIAALRAAINPAPDVDHEAEHGLTWDVACERIEAGAHPLLEARVLYADAQQVESHYLRPMAAALIGDGRIYPHYMIHTQETGRWSITGPPLQQLPKDLRDLIIPDEGEVWIGWDWTSIEEVLLAALANETVLLDAYARDDDTHSMVTQRLFWGETKEERYAYVRNLSGVREDILRTALMDQTGDVVLAAVRSAQAESQGLQAYLDQWEALLRAPTGHERWPGRGCTSQEWKQARQPPRELGEDDTIRARSLACAVWVICGGPPPNWQGGDDLRRVFAKRFKYRLYYLGEPKSAANIPGAKGLGLDGAKLVKLSQKFMGMVPRLAAFRDRVTTALSREPRIRTFAGRPRVALGSRGPAAVRELWNHQFQGGVADVLNTTIVALMAALPWARLVYTAHDAGTVAVPESRVAEALPVVKQIVQRPIAVGAREVSFPAKYQLTLADGGTQVA